MLILLLQSLIMLMFIVVLVEVSANCQYLTENDRCFVARHTADLEHWLLYKSEDCNRKVLANVPSRFCNRPFIFSYAFLHSDHDYVGDDVYISDVCGENDSCFRLFVCFVSLHHFVFAFGCFFSCCHWAYFSCYFHYLSCNYVQHYYLSYYDWTSYYLHAYFGYYDDDDDDDDNDVYGPCYLTNLANLCYHCHLKKQQLY